MNKLISTVFLVGFFPVAPGTFGSLFAVLIGYFVCLYGGFPLLLLMTIFTAAMGVYSVKKYIFNYSRPSDPKEVVIDEVVGQWISYLPTSFAIWAFNFDESASSPYLWLCSFIFFRIFDILKPWPINWADSKHSSIGVMLDDAFAGVYASAITLFALIIF